MTGITSQRAITTLLIAAVFIVGTVLAVADGNRFSSGTDLLISLGALAAAVVGWFAMLDNQIASGAVQPGDIAALLLMPSWWVLMFTALASVTQITGYKFFDPDQQELLIASITGLVGLVFLSFGGRLPQQPPDA